VPGFLARIKASVCQADWQRAPGQADVRTLCVIGDALLSCLVTPVHRAGAGILRPPGGATFLARDIGKSSKKILVEATGRRAGSVSSAVG